MPVGTDLSRPRPDRQSKRALRDVFNGWERNQQGRGRDKSVPTIVQQFSVIFHLPSRE